MQYKLMKINATSAGKIQGLIMAVMIGIFAVPGGLIMAISGKVAEGLAIMVFAPGLYGLFGFIAGAVGAKIFSAAAGKIGGLRIEVEEEKTAPSAPSVSPTV